jgi:hypothetical protein
VTLLEIVRERGRSKYDKADGRTQSPKHFPPIERHAASDFPACVRLSLRHVTG